MEKAAGRRIDESLVLSMPVHALPTANAMRSRTPRQACPSYRVLSSIAFGPTPCLTRSRTSACFASLKRVL